MSEIVKTPVWFWVMSIFALIWNLYGLMDYYMSMTLNETYLGQMDGMIEFIKNMPLWAKAVWGVAIIASTFGSLCLVLRKAIAYKLYILAVIAMLPSFAYQILSGTMPAVPGWMHIFTAVIVLFAFFLIWFAKRMTDRGILR